MAADGEGVEGGSRKVEKAELEKSGKEPACLPWSWRIHAGLRLGSAGEGLSMAKGGRLFPPQPLRFALEEGAAAAAAR